MRGAAAILLLIGVVACEASEVAGAIRQVFQTFAEACARGDRDAVLALYDEGARVIWLGEPEEARGRRDLERLVAAGCRRELEATIDLDDIEVRSLGPDHAVAVLHGVYGLRALDGGRASYRVRSMQVLVRRADGWQILTEHSSIGLPPPNRRTDR